MDIPYPGFEGRPAVGSLDEFLAAMADFSRTIRPRPVAAVASGIGAMIALGLRSRGELLEVPMIFQGPVLWGLEQRTFPKLMRPRLARRLLKWLITLPIVQARFTRKHLRRPIDRQTRDRFFAGYAECSAFSSFFDWFTPDLLRTLEAKFRESPRGLERVTIWNGGHDDVVGLDDVCATEHALGVAWPVVTFPKWGHYPTIDEPEEWAEALCHALDGP